MAVLIGSQAARFWLTSYRRCKDIDLVGSIEELWKLKQNGFVAEAYPTTPYKFRLRLHDATPGEYEFIEASESANFLYNMHHPGQWSIGSIPIRVPSIGTLLALKESHRHLLIHWHKTQKDWHFLLPHAEFRSREQQELLQKRRCEAETRKKSKRKKPAFNIPISVFFQQHQVERAIPHDDLHERVARGTPAFRQFLKNDGTAAFDPKKWKEGSLEQKLASAREEIAVLALERAMIPGITDNIDDAWRTAFAALATRLSSGSFQKFLLDHYPLLERPDRILGLHLVCLATEIRMQEKLQISSIR